MRVWLVTGAARGLGRELVRQAIAEGDAVVATARNPDRFDFDPHERLLTLAHDVTDEGRAAEVVDAALARFGRIDVLVNNAGAALLGAVEETTLAQARAVFETNVFGLLAVTRAVLPVLRRQRGGHLVALSSMGGFAAGAGFGVYAASKFAVEGLHEALAEELAPFGVRVTIVEPGVFATGFGHGSARTEPIDGYTHPRYDDEQIGGHDPAWGVAEIRRAVADPASGLRLPLGADAIARIGAKLAAVRTELDAVPRVTSPTGHDFPAGAEMELKSEASPVNLPAAQA